jgi:hypothetical protein
MSLAIRKDDRAHGWYHPAMEPHEHIPYLREAVV